MSEFNLYQHYKASKEVANSVVGLTVIEMDSLPENIYDTVLLRVERPMIEAVLKRTNGNQSKAAKILGLNRGTLYKKMKACGLV